MSNQPRTSDIGVNEGTFDKLADRRKQHPRRRVRIGFIGAGWWATTNHMPMLYARRDVVLASACGLDLDILNRVQSDFGFEHTTSDYRELLEKELGRLRDKTATEALRHKSASTLRELLARLPLRRLQAHAADAADGPRRQRGRHEDLLRPGRPRDLQGQVRPDADRRLVGAPRGEVRGGLRQPLGPRQDAGGREGPL